MTVHAFAADSLRVRESEDNSAVIRAAQDALRLIQNKLLPAACSWVQVCSWMRAGPWVWACSRLWAGSGVRACSRLWAGRGLGVRLGQGRPLGPDGPRGLTAGAGLALGESECLA